MLEINYHIGDDITFIPSRYCLVKERGDATREVHLSQKECQLLEFFCEHPQQVMSREEFISALWNNSESSDAGLNKNILMIRRKLESLGVMDSIRTVPRVGYMMDLTILKEELIIDDAPDTVTHDALVGELVDETDTGRDLFDEPPLLQPAWHRSRVILKRGIMVSLLLGLLGLLVLAGWFLLAEEESLPYLTKKITTRHGIIYRVDGANPPISSATLEMIDKASAQSAESEYRMMIADHLISLVSYEGDRPLWEKVYFVQHDASLEPQLRCIAQHLSVPPFRDFPAPMGEGYYNNVNFYAPCDGTEHPVLAMQVRHKGYGAPIHEFVQEVSLVTPAGEEMAELTLLKTRDGRLTEINGRYPDYVMKAHLQSVHVKALESELLTPYRAAVMSIMTSEEEHLRYTLEAQKVLHASTVHGGFLMLSRRAPD
ncbi:winged helix-turn-helix domain-containing protein [Aeromonas sp. 601027]|uniref:winged helix-turn-helix domain-containing protein n=1 Tax=Aeromonas sp. 601027 TaxID=2712036 RepID=UPI003BA3B928